MPDPSHVCVCHSSQQYQIRNPLSEAASSWVLVGLVSIELQGELLQDLLFFFFLFCLFAISWAAPAAYGGTQARGPVGAVAASLR